ncbi:MAG TPA: BtpA/SgcQ family protein [Capillimicrobium sp.]|nr:BtpA/SgcQ family protein [Capillimicrobium sp.]
MKRPRFTDLFDAEKPVIAMAHLPPLPGTPLYDAAGGMDAIVEAVRADLEELYDAGVDGVMFCNEGDRPYQLTADPAGIAALCRVVTELKPADRPFGVDFLWDPQAALAVAVATGASWIREVATGVYESDMGLWNTNAAALLRERRRLDADGIHILMNVTPEFASQIGQRTVAQVARSAVTSSLADAILVSGPMAGAEPELSKLQEARDAVGGDVPVFVNTGAKESNVSEFLTVADGVIVGSSLKRDGVFWNPVERARVDRFLEAARA